MALMRSIVSLSLAAVAGALVLAVVVAPITFEGLPSDHLAAGQIAGKIFSVTYGAAAVVLFCALAIGWKLPRTRVVIGVGLLSALVLVFFIVPMVRSHGQGWPGSFAALHLTAGALHLIVLISAAASAWRLRALATRRNHLD